MILSNEIVGQGMNKQNKNRVLQLALFNIICIFSSAQTCTWSTTSFIEQHIVYGTKRVATEIDSGAGVTKRHTGWGLYEKVKDSNAPVRIREINDFHDQFDVIGGTPRSIVRERRKAKHQKLLKTYEIGNHLGNVLVNTSDLKLGNDIDANRQSDNYVADIIEVNDYYPFGMQQHNRNIVVSKSPSRFGFQDQEKDDEIFGNGNAQAYKYRINDARLGRFFAVDPLEKKYPYNSQYAFSENSVIYSVELEGLEKRIVVNEIWVEGIHIGSQIGLNTLNHQNHEITKNTFYIVKNKVNNENSFSSLKNAIARRPHIVSEKIANEYSANYFLNSSEEELEIFYKKPIDYATKAKKNLIIWVSSKYTLRTFYDNDVTTSTITDDRKKTLMEVSNILKNTKNISVNINVSAFASEPASGEYNQNLSNQRAADMKRNLIAEFKKNGATDEQLKKINWTESSNGDTQTTGTDRYDRRSTADITFSQSQ